MLPFLLRIWQAVVGHTPILQQILRLEQSNAETLAQLLKIVRGDPAIGFQFFDDNTGVPIMAATLRDDQNIPLTIQPVDAKGKPALLDGVPTWASSDETVITVTAAADGLSATAAAVAPGSARITVSGDGDLGSGVTPITGTLDVSVTGGGAVSITINAGAPVPQGAAPNPNPSTGDQTPPGGSTPPPQG